MSANRRRALFLLASASAALLAAACDPVGPNPGPSGGAGSSSPFPSTAVSTMPNTPASAVPPQSGSAPPSARAAAYYYQGADAALYRLENGELKKIAGVAPYSASVSPDGDSIAFLDETGVVVTDRDGRNKRTVLDYSAGAGSEPVWSPDSKRLFVTAKDNKVGIVAVAGKQFAPLKNQPAEIIHPLWSGDGKRIVFATGICGIHVMNVDGSEERAVPTPGGWHSCDPYSTNADGSLVAINQRVGDQEDGDIGRDSVANAIVDTRTGNTVGLPGLKDVNAIVFLPGGELVVRTPGKLTVLRADLSRKSETSEPAGARNYRLISAV